MMLLPAAAHAFNPVQEARNFSKIGERYRYVTGTPEFQLLLQEQNARSPIDRNRITADDPERSPEGNVCEQRTNECAGDVRFYDWEGKGYGLMHPVLFTARDGATISGTVWATRAGPSSRPGIVITTGSVQAPEPLYWGTAATLAKHGFVVLTYDVQGQGMSDTFGEGVDRMEGVPSQSGEPFYDGTEDALDFLLSTPADPYRPRPSCSTGTDHSAKQDRRVEAGLNAGYDPFWQLVDPDRVGIAGHSLGAAAVSYVGQEDPRVDAIVAWDDLAGSDGSGGGFGSVPSCDANPGSREPVPMTKPAIGFSNDYSLVPEPYTGDPDPLGRNTGFAAYRAAGVDSMQVDIRGGTHYEYSLIPGNTVPVFGTATFRGIDLATWYTIAWFDKYVKGAAHADGRLLTTRWLHDAPTAKVDPNGDGNMLSFYLRSQYDFHTSDGTEVTCDDMRGGCANMAPDGIPGRFWQVDSLSPDTRAAHPARCAVFQLGGPGDDDFSDLPPTDGGDRIQGAGGNDYLLGGYGDDCLDASTGDDRLDGGAGADQVNGGVGNDLILGGSGQDVLAGDRGADRIGAADIQVDHVYCGPGNDTVWADLEDVVARDCEHVHQPASPA
jgi:dienelactone hydrolase